MTVQEAYTQLVKAVRGYKTTADEHTRLQEALDLITTRVQLAHALETERIPALTAELDAAKTRIAELEIEFETAMRPEHDATLS